MPNSYPFILYQVEVDPINPQGTPGAATSLQTWPDFAVVLPHKYRTQRFLKLDPDKVEPIVVSQGTTGNATQLMTWVEFPAMLSHRQRAARFIKLAPDGAKPIVVSLTGPATGLQTWPDMVPPSFARHKAGKLAAVMASGGVGVGEPTDFPVENVTVDKWFQAFIDPRRSKPITHPARTSGGVLVQLGTVPETITMDKWFQAFSEPKRFRRGPTAPRIEDFYVGFDTNPNETVFMDKWFKQWQDPVRLPRRLHARHNEDIAFAFPPTFLENVLVDKWYSNFVNPPKLQRLNSLKEVHIVSQGTVITPPSGEPGPTFTYISGLGGSYLQLQKEFELLMESYNGGANLLSRWFRTTS